MSYLALARKWRPTKFNEVVGQAHVLTALENALAQNKLHHAYLFSGTRGVGKTSIGRLFAKGLNCETGITATPCGVCDTCREIDQGRFVDLLEIDAASRTKVEDTRDLLDNVQYKPARGRFKIYLIDEVHMLSRHSFNALLKTLEEPPEYVKFLLATTDPQKLPVTVLSRCLQFHLKPISVDCIHEQLEHILTTEKVTFDGRALGMIAHAADGSMRDALSLTDQAIALGNNHVTSDVVAPMLGTLDTDHALHLLKAISQKELQVMMDCVTLFAQNGVEWDGLLQQLSTQLHRIAMYQALPATLDKTQPDAEKIQQLSQKITPQDVQLYYQIALKGRDDLTRSPTPRIGLEMVLLRMLAFQPVSSNANAADVNAAHSHTMTPSSAPSMQAVMPESTAMSAKPVDSNTATASQQTNAIPSPISDEVTANTEAAQNQSETASRTSLGGLRHQLRSQRQSLEQRKQGTQVQGAVTKKFDAAPKVTESIIDRVAQHAKSISVSPVESKITQQPLSSSNSSSSHTMTHANEIDYDDMDYDDEYIETTELQNEEPYQWRASQPAEENENKLTPTLIKKELEHHKTPEMMAMLITEACNCDEWSTLIQTLNTAKLVEQLALNSVYHKQGSTIELTLRPHHTHLNTERAQRELLQALNRALNEQCHLTVTIGTDGETPLELRERLYQVKLDRAIASLESDRHVQFIKNRFAAVLEQESIRPI